jgi:hypothetical protein
MTRFGTSLVNSCRTKFSVATGVRGFAWACMELSRWSVYGGSDQSMHKRNASSCAAKKAPPGTSGAFFRERVSS